MRDGEAFTRPPVVVGGVGGSGTRLIAHTHATDTCSSAEHSASVRMWSATPPADSDCQAYFDKLSLRLEALHVKTERLDVCDIVTVELVTAMELIPPN